MWDRDAIPGVVSPGAYYQIQTSHGLRISIPGFPGWRLMKYISLTLDNHILYGLTMFCTDEGGISGIGSHFKANNLSEERKALWTGSQIGCPIHFRMKDTERITSLGFCQRDHYSSLFILVCVYALHPGIHRYLPIYI